MKRPAMMFYVADWRGNAKLRRCSRAEKGDWIELICLFHDSDEYGLLRWPLREIAQAIGCPVAELKRGLIAKGVLKGADVGERCAAYLYTPRHAGKDGTPVTLIPEQDGPIWYSSRMVRDAYLLATRGASSRFGSPERREGAAPKPTPTRRQGDGLSVSSSISSSKNSSPPTLQVAADVEKKLVYPSKLADGQRADVDRAVAELDQREAQLVVDELEGAMRYGRKPIAEPIAFLRSLVHQYRAGRFVSSHAARVQIEREGDQVKVEAAAARARAGRGAASVPEPAS